MYKDDKIIIRPTELDDIPVILKLEADPENRRFITPWLEAEHQAALTDPQEDHLVILDAGSHQLVGFIILGLKEAAVGTIELTRIVIGPKRLGYGRRALRAIQQISQDVYQAQKIWLDVFADNAKAKTLYRSEGFQYIKTVPWTEADGTERELEVHEKQLS